MTGKTYQHKSYCGLTGQLAKWTSKTSPGQSSKLVYALNIRMEDRAARPNVLSPHLSGCQHGAAEVGGLWETYRGVVALPFESLRGFGGAQVCVDVPATNRATGSL